ncbi:MAG: hypothetical protein HXN58_02245 [Prevotella pallens]|uniref:hypothetical protein n=1 Tax=Prevotella pallens TaxID=60133 RepID=UPI001CAD3D23|nr:hypothetical protein [Prevotella pallens]MBF1442538.1 hypothetical protein [Prevotella pallens]
MDGRDESVPYAYGMYAAIVYAQSMFTPRTYDIYPRTTTFTPTCTHCRGRFIVPAYHGTHAVDCPRTPMFICERPIY